MPRHGWRQRVWFYSPPVEGCPSGAGWLLLGFGFLGLAFGTGGLASPPPSGFAVALLRWREITAAMLSPVPQLAAAIRLVGFISPWQPLHHSNFEHIFRNGF